MRQGLILTGLGIAVWGAATLFFRIFGHWLLAEPGEAGFGPSLFLLELLTLLVLIGLALFVRLKMFREKGAATRFGVTAAAVGLLLDTLSVWQRESVFPAFTEGEHHTFAVWMTLAYALMLIVPAAVDRLVQDGGAKEIPSVEDEMVRHHDRGLFEKDALQEEGAAVADTDRTT